MVLLHSEDRCPAAKHTAAFAMTNRPRLSVSRAVKALTKRVCPMRATYSGFCRWGTALGALEMLMCSVICCFAQLDSTWTVTVSGQTVQVNVDGSFIIPNISAPDAFGPEGP